MATQIAQSGHTPPRLDPWARVNCFHYGWTGHIAKDCKQKTWVCTLLPIWRDQTRSLKLFRKQARTKDISAAPLSRQDVNKAQPISWVHVDQTPCSALLDSGCFCTIVSTRLCCTYSKRSIKIRSINGET